MRDCPARRILRNVKQFSGIKYHTLAQPCKRVYASRVMGYALDIERIDPTGLTYGSCVLGAGDDIPRCGACGLRLEFMGSYGGVPIWGHGGACSGALDLSDGGESIIAHTGQQYADGIKQM